MATNELVKTAQAAEMQKDMRNWEVMEKVLIDGDLRKLSSQERTLYYRSVCESLGLNPLTRPFEYVMLNSKLTLYARKDCAEQLRSTRNVSTQILERSMDDKGIYTVAVRATLPDGRSDEDIGCVAIGTLQGEARANALMKTITKAKRRVTLSICGLAFPTEEEIADIPGAEVIEVGEDGEIKSKSVGVIGKKQADPPPAQPTNGTPATATQVSGSPGPDKPPFKASDDDVPFGKPQPKRGRPPKVQHAEPNADPMEQFFNKLESAKQKLRITNKPDEDLAINRAVSEFFRGYLGYESSASMPEDPNIFLPIIPSLEEAIALSVEVFLKDAYQLGKGMANFNGKQPEQPPKAAAIAHPLIVHACRKIKWTDETIVAVEATRVLRQIEPPEFLLWMKALDIHLLTDEEALAFFLVAVETKDADRLLKLRDTSGFSIPQLRNKYMRLATERGATSERGRFSVLEEMEKDLAKPEQSQPRLFEG